jgi:hypothetical protein
MPIGMDPSPKTSINSTDQASKRGVENPPPSTAFVLGPLNTRGISSTPSEPGGSLPRAMPKFKAKKKVQAQLRRKTR